MPNVSIGPDIDRSRGEGSLPCRQIRGGNRFDQGKQVALHGSQPPPSEIMGLNRIPHRRRVIVRGASGDLLPATRLKLTR